VDHPPGTAKLPLLSTLHDGGKFDKWPLVFGNDHFFAPGGEFDQFRGNYISFGESIRPVEILKITTCYL
jgi:hypothetical protein